MKNLKYYLFTLVCMIAVSSCSLDETSYMEIEKKDYMNNAAEAEKVLLGVYRDMVQDGMYGFHLSLYFTLPNDLAKVEGVNIDGFRLIPSNAYTSSLAENRTTWLNLYNAIYDANYFIEALQRKIESYDAKDYKLAAVYMAEARCLRALYYFELLRWYGHIALITNTAQSYQDPATFVQADPAEVYRFIEADLQYGIDNLPYAVDDNIRSDNSFRFSKGAALGLLTKVYATWAGAPVHDTSKWERAAKTAKVLVESGKHSLLEEYDQLWKNTCNGVWDNRESLIEVSFYSPSLTGTAAYDPSGRIGKWNGVAAPSGAIKGVRNAANWYVIPTFLDKWKKSNTSSVTDVRWGISFADYKYVKSTNGEYGVKGPIYQAGYTIEDALKPAASDDIKKKYINGVNPGKWDTEEYVKDANCLVDGNMSNINWYILRYADVLLLYAEALNEWRQGPTDDAYAAVNAVRRRGFNLPIGTASSASDLSGLSYGQFQKAIRDERAYELAFEGHRRQDLVRWGIYYESIKQTAQDLTDWYVDGENYYVCSQYTQKDKHELLPIPLQELDIMPQFKQSSGW